MFSHPPPHLSHHPLAHQALHRPPTAPSTPDTETATHSWPSQAFPHLQGQPTNLPPYMFERRQQYTYGSASDSLRAGAGHTPQLGNAQSATPGAGAPGPLLPQNLAQHLNNPPPPTSQPHNLSNQAQNISTAGVAMGAGAGGKVLLMPNGAPPPAGSEEEKIYVLITELLEPETREAALLELSKKRELYEDLALVLWGGFGIMSSLLLEIVAVYPALSPPSLTAHASNRVCNALALLQCVASHSDTRSLFLNAHIPLFLYPFLNTTSKTRPFEYLRLTSLGVIGALVKQNDNSDVINFLLSTEIIPLCLRIMETGSELSKTVAIFIVQKILADDLGLQYICQTYERFYAVGTVLANMVDALVESQAVRLLKHVVRCYLRMSDNPRAREALRACLPKALQDNTFAPLLKGDIVTKRCLQTLLMNLNERPTAELQ
ncbi:cell differentiation protein rcd1 [Cryptococcus depauperatus CBS 7841]|uniref:Cell differentiation protein rcd1 n=1 Tax=Cryptococcus depauperatus CBS 7841 TaxID=1295531 RepID=A0A1E3IWY0_9TREE|nr:cell differentiation protein rcd1 [Cryptococcus depauperatus CBS 7841]ODO02709.1 cell differentiation protein rcd1 [Cryptococcus depauperatus CBS 7855]